jgi:hypothetical protein
VTEATDAPTEAPYEAHVVRLIMTVPARSPEEAVARFVEELVGKGLRNWVYGVLDPDTGATVAELNGYGEDQTELIERLLTAEAEEDGEKAAESVAELPEPSEPATPSVESDEELTRLAEGLNAGQ